MSVVSAQSFAVNAQNYWIVQIALREECPPLSELQHNAYFVWSLEHGTILVARHVWEDLCSSEAFIEADERIVNVYTFDVEMS